MHHAQRRARYSNSSAQRPGSSGRRRRRPAISPRFRRNGQASGSHRPSGDSFPILACDFFAVDTVWLRRLYVLAFIAIGSRRIEYFAITSKPNTAWMLQQARNLLMQLDDRDRQVRFLIHDRDTKFPRALTSS